MQCPPARVGALKKKPLGSFGDLVTLDHAIFSQEKSIGLGHSQYLSVARDYVTGWIDAIPVQRKSGEDSLRAFMQFRGNQEIRYMYSDNSLELQYVAEHLHITHGTSAARYPRNNALAERAVRSALEGIRTVLEHSGLPTMFWPYAARHFSHSHNICRQGCARYADVMDVEPQIEAVAVCGKAEEDHALDPGMPSGSFASAAAVASKGDTAWELRHGKGPWKGPMIPFGSYVHYLSPPSTHLDRPKAAPKAVPGIFLQSVTQPGGGLDRRRIGHVTGRHQRRGL